MQNLATFAEVLCHEIGHALNLAHSSENAAEPNTVLKEAIMYFQAHADGRGATLGAYDPPVIQQVYPFNTPPFTFSRVMDVVTAPSAPNVPGVNEVELRGYDLQTANLTFAAAGATAHHGSFSLAGTKVRFTPNGWYSDSPRSHPGGNSFYDVIYGRFSDGTNASPYARVAVVSLTDDGDSPSDGIPDSWMMAYFGHPNPQAGDQSRATDDADGDGLTNLQEFIAGMNPRDANSAQRITAFNLNSISLQAKAYELYQVLGSTNLASWTAVGIPFVPTNASLANVTTLPVTNIIGTIPGFPATNNHLFFRVEKVP
jgi:hypothetical protein